MFEVKRDIFSLLCKKNAELPFGVRISNFVKDIGILAGHISHNQIGKFDLAVYPLKNSFAEDLLIYSLGKYSKRCRRLFNSKFVDIVKCLIERHKHESKEFILTSHKVLIKMSKVQ